MSENIQIQITPNPNALKFILAQDVLKSGKATFASADEAKALPLAKGIMDLGFTEQVHMYENVITVTKSGDQSWDDCEEKVIDAIKANISLHDADFQQQGEAPTAQGSSDELKKIEEILDRTIRPGLRGDGGDLEVVSLENKVLTINYQGACGSCPAAITGTLQAIKQILRDEYDPDLDVVPAGF